MTDWLIANLPPELGPWMQYAAAHFDVFRPVAIVFLLAVVVVVVTSAWIVGRFVWERVR